MTRTRCLFVEVAQTILIGGVCGLMFLMAGCGTLDQGPASEATGESVLGSGQDLGSPDGGVSGPKGFFPLSIGNRWTYAGELTILMDDGVPSVFERKEVRSLIGTEERFGREYVVEKQYNIDEDGDTLAPYWYRYRQDRAGLYTADIAASEPPLDGFARAPYLHSARGSRSERMARIWDRISRRIETGDREAYSKAWERLCVKLRAIGAAGEAGPGYPSLGKGPPGGVLPEEITMLAYPLHPGQEWVIRDDPFYVGAFVECHEVLELTPGRFGGYKIGIDNGLFGPNDWAYVWYGRDGFLGSRVHVESEILDPYGNPMGTMIADEYLFLESLDLVKKGRW